MSKARLVGCSSEVTESTLAPGSDPTVGLRIGQTVTFIRDYGVSFAVVVSPGDPDSLEWVVLRADLEFLP